MAAPVITRQIFKELPGDSTGLMTIRAAVSSDTTFGFRVSCRSLNRCPVCRLLLPYRNSTCAKTYTYADYLTRMFPERMALIRGRVRPISPITWRVHQTISVNFIGLLHPLRKQGCFDAYPTPFDVRLPQAGQREHAQITTVVQLDFRDARNLNDLGGTAAPDWIIEILSPKTMDYAIRTKFRLYEESGVSEYWIVFPGEKTVATYVLEDGRYQSRGAYFEPGLLPCHTLPELQLQWEQVFAGV